VITLDTDWAPDWAIDRCADLLIDRETKATWFVTHESDAIFRLRERPDLFELGIHPNFGPDSSHGDTVEEVLEHCLEIVPEAACVRTHGLIQSPEIYDELIDLTAIRTDVSLFVLGGSAWVEPFRLYWENDMLVRIPFGWMDDTALWAHEFGRQPLELPAGVVSAGTVLAFHPLLVAVNAYSTAWYRLVRARVPLLDETPAQTAKPGVGDLFVAAAEARGATISELRAGWEGRWATSNA
jgi:hypothetical protein